MNLQSAIVLQAGGPGSGPHKKLSDEDYHKMWEKTSVGKPTDPKKNYTTEELQKFKDKHGLKAGGPGSGPHAPCPSCGPQQRVDTRQTSVYGPKHGEELRDWYERRQKQVDSYGKALNQAAKNVVSDHRNTDFLDRKAMRAVFHKHFDIAEKFHEQGTKLLQSAEAREHLRKAREELNSADNNIMRSSSVAMGNVSSAFHYLRQAVDAGPIPEEHKKLMKEDPRQMRLFSSGKKIKAGEENVEMEGINPGRRGKRIVKVGTQYCVQGAGVDTNFGCYPSREKAQAVLQGKSFIEPDMKAGAHKDPTDFSKYGDVTHLAYRNIRWGTDPDTGEVVPDSDPKVEKFRSKWKKRIKKASKSVVGGVVDKEQKVQAFADMGEPMAGSMGHAHIDPMTWFSPPSLKKRGKETHIPTDDPGEKDNKFLDVTKRNSKDTKEQRMKLLKRSAPGGLPAQLPARTTLVAPHTATYLPGMFGKAVRVRPAKDIQDKRMRRAYGAARI